MRLALAVLGLVMVVCAALVATSPSPVALLSGVPLAAALTIAVQATARTMSRFVLGYPSERGGVYPPRRGRIAVVGLAALGLEFLVMAGGPTQSRWILELGYYLVLIGAGLALARWCRSSEQAPVFLSTGVSVVLSIAATLMLGWPAASEGGTEQWMLVIWNIAAGTMTLLPLDASATWAAWHVSAVRGHGTIAGAQEAQARRADS
jgi:hypothetical protein